jgi:hypothetical protein
LVTAIGLLFQLHELRKAPRPNPQRKAEQTEKLFRADVLSFREVVMPLRGTLEP